MSTDVRIFSTRDEMADAASNLFYDAGQQAIDKRGVFHVVLSGGSTPVHMYRQIRSDRRIDRFNWENVFVYWGDERCVPPDHPESNYRLAKDELLGFLPIPIENIHRMKGETNPPDAAADYQTLLMNTFGSRPEFDLIYLGLGDDGHTASLFPGLDISTDNHVWVQSVLVDKLQSYRLTLTPQAINSARQVAFLVTGEKKSEVVLEILGKQKSQERFPAEMISPNSGELVWLLDQNAARMIES
jgi:6-phosphogluconolactonase